MEQQAHEHVTPIQKVEQDILLLIKLCKRIREGDLSAQISLAMLLVANPNLLSVVKKYFRRHFIHLSEIIRDTQKTELIKFFDAADERIEVEIVDSDKTQDYRLCGKSEYHKSVKFP